MQATRGMGEGWRVSKKFLATNATTAVVNGNGTATTSAVALVARKLLGVLDSSLSPLLA